MIEPKKGNMRAQWIDSGREPQCAPNPAYPMGIDVNAAEGKGLRCKIDLTYPAPRCGYWDVQCRVCGHRSIITTAGRPDDPRSLTVPCALDS